jgi:CCR4-NOT transcription complex subunit 1
MFHMQDFAFESNEQRMRTAAHLMAASLAGAYAMNQCREPMRASLLTQLHALLKPGLDPLVIITADDLAYNAGMRVLCHLTFSGSQEGC